jgi:hypothetical protein
MPVQQTDARPISRRDYFNKRLSTLEKERSSFISQYQDITDYIVPRRGRYEISDRNKGDKRHDKIINSRGTMAGRTLASGLMAGLTSPARPWMEIGTPDPDMMKFAPVKEWLRLLTKIMFQIYAQGNLYNILPLVYSETGHFGTGCMTHVDDFQDVARFYAHTVGSYMIAQNDRLVVDTIVREFEMTVGNMVSQFGLENVSTAARNLWDRGNYDAVRPVVHFVEPNPERNFGSKFAQDMPFRSVYYEKGNNDKNKFLQEKGFEEFPGYAPRWDVTDNDIYGTNCPGMTALGDIKALQTLEKRKAQAVDKMVNPPLKGPGSLKNYPITTLPGGTNMYDGDTTREGLQPLYQVDPRLTELTADIAAHENRINEAFYADLFLQLANLQGVQPRNQLELAQRNEEKLLMLGPVLERMHGELLDPMNDRTFNQIMRAGIMPPPPEELAGQPLKVTYISSLAMAQRAVATGTIDRMVGFIGGFAEVKPDALDKLNADAAIDEYSNALGAPPRLINDGDTVNAIRQKREERIKQQQQLQLAQIAASAAKDASAADTSGDNLLSKIVEQGQGPQGG